MSVIYEPKGKALEYAPLACNLYRGCSHRCTYCYAPAVLKLSRDAFANAAPRVGILKEIEKAARGIDPADERRILLSFTSDCYQPREAEEKLTRETIRLFGEAGAKLAVLTKNPELALRDLDLIKRYDVHVGSTILFTNDASRAEFEPGAAPIASRMAAMRKFHAEGVSTWVSIEPVIIPAEALGVVAELGDAIDLWKIGRWNYDARAKEIDWPGFLDAMLVMLKTVRGSYYIKHDLWALASPEALASYRQSA